MRRHGELDAEISRLLEAERAADESAAPGLDALLGRARPNPPGAALALQRLALAAAVAGVIAAAAAVVRSGESADAARSTPASATMQIAEWRSPTAFLLDTPGAELLTEVPTLITAPDAEDPEVSAPQRTKGVSR